MENSNRPEKNIDTSESLNQAHSKTFKWIVFGLAQFIILIAVFSLGAKVGFHQAHFTESWERGYPANFGLPVRHSPQSPFLNAHGVFGSILNVNGNNLTIKDSDNNEKPVVIDAGTSIRKNFTDLKPADLKVNDSIIVIGEPNEQGQILAKFIRVLNAQ